MKKGVIKKCEYCKVAWCKKSWRRFCSLSCSAKFCIENELIPAFKDGHKLRVGMKHPASFIEHRKALGNPAWKGNRASVGSIHCWVRDNFEKVKTCEVCGSSTEKMYDWSNKNHKYSRDRKDWWVLCRKCHMAYDRKTFHEATR